MSTHDDRARGAPIHRRILVRRVAAGLSAVTAGLYLLVGLEILPVVETPSAAAPDMLGFGLSAGLAFAVGTGLLLLLDRRPLWVLGAILQVLVIVMYVQVAPQRTPPFETWGVVIKIIQAAILATLLYLVVRPTAPAPDAGFA